MRTLARLITSGMSLKACLSLSCVQRWSSNCLIIVSASVVCISQLTFSVWNEISNFWSLHLTRLSVRSNQMSVVDPVECSHIRLQSHETPIVAMVLHVTWSKGLSVQMFLEVYGNSTFICHDWYCVCWNLASCNIRHLGFGRFVDHTKIIYFDCCIVKITNGTPLCRLHTMTHYGLSIEHIDCHD